MDRDGALEFAQHVGLHGGRHRGQVGAGEPAQPGQHQAHGLTRGPRASRLDRGPLACRACGTGRAERGTR